MLNRLSFILLSASLLGLSACNGTDQGGQAVGDDWKTAVPSNPPETESPAPVPIPRTPPTPTPSPTASPHPAKLYTGPDSLNQYIAKFAKDAEEHRVDISPELNSPGLTVRFGSLKNYGSATIGLCESGGNIRRVTFDTTFWNKASETSRELLAHHEFGHCVLRRPHNSRKTSTGIPASIMSPFILNAASYLSNYGYYLNELFDTNAQDVRAMTADEVNTDICDHSDVFSEEPTSE